MGPCPICGIGWGGLHRTLTVFLYGISAVVCVIMSGIALEQMGGFQLSYMEGTFTFPFCLRAFIICS